MYFIETIFEVSLELQKGLIDEIIDDGLGGEYLLLDICIEGVYPPEELNLYERSITLRVLFCSREYMVL